MLGKYLVFPPKIIAARLLHKILWPELDGWRRPTDGMTRRGIDGRMRMRVRGGDELMPVDGWLVLFDTQTR